MAKTNNESSKRQLPPYVSWKTFLTFLDKMKVGIPSHIDRSVLGGMSGANQSYLLSSLRGMNLINDVGVPSDALKKLVHSEGAERQEILADIFSETYMFLTDANIDLDTAPVTKLIEGFKESGATGDTVHKCRSFFLALAKAAGLEVSPHFKKAPAQLRLSRRRAPKKQSGGGAVNDTNSDDESFVEKSPHEVLFELLDPENMSDEEQQAVWTLIKYLKKSGEAN